MHINELYICQKLLFITDFISVFIPLFFILFFLTAFFGTSFIVSKKIGKNPNVLPEDDSAYGLIGRYFKLTLLFLFIYTVLFFFFPYSILQNCSINFLENNTIKYFGMSLMILSLLWVLIAQLQMKNSWRIGIDEELKIELITTGLLIFQKPDFSGNAYKFNRIIHDFAHIHFIKLFCNIQYFNSNPDQIRRRISLKTTRNVLFKV
ncbi:hypothetical protein [Chryseobacterium sp. 2R14A]|uniref:hypothetical protein n=1 Tax=Chryseobacterium sp. 2R14A TaxID=3380353 RepID=UPI003CE80DC5